MIEHIAGLMHTLLSFLAVISIIVFIHEFGHYFFARLCGVKVEVFSIGFGKEVFGWKSKSGTHWKFCALPFGGYVKMFGDETAASTPDFAKIDSMSEHDRKISFHYQPLWRKALIVFGGPFFNFVLTIAIFTALIFNNGLVSSEPVIGSVLEKSAAEEAGLKVDDRILAVGNEKIKEFQDIPIAIATNLGEPTTLTLLRDSKKIQVSITPKITEIADNLGNKVKHPRIGIASPKLSVKELGIFGALSHAVMRTYQICEATLKVLGQLITGQRDTAQMKGPIGIAQMSGQATESGSSTFIWFIAMLSANLGLVNLLPIPLLDGGHLMYYALEAVRGRPLAKKAQEFGFKIGFVILSALMIFTILNDVIGLF